MPLLDPPYHFLFVSCQVGADSTLKEEVTSKYPQLRFAFSRPGFVTFKSDQALELGASRNGSLDLVFGRSTGISLGRVRTDEPHLIQSLSRTASDLKTTLIQVWERDQYKPGEAPPQFNERAWTQEAIELITSNGLPVEDRSPRASERVLDIIVVDPQEWWIGAHVHSTQRCPAPGGRPMIPMSPQAPSRAYLKIKEAIAWSGVTLQPTDVALEIGSAPGGASFALLELGLRVVGIDPGAMDARVQAQSRFTHLQMPYSQVAKHDLEDLEGVEAIHWLLVDMNVPPQVSLSAVERMLELLEEPSRGQLKGLLLTIKLNHWRIAREIPLILDRLKELGMEQIRATQLAHNRQEIFVYAQPKRKTRK